MVRGLTAGAFFRGCVDRRGRILSVDETATATGRAGRSLLDLIVPAEHPVVTGLLADRSWRGLRALRISVAGRAGPIVLVALGARRLVDVAMILLRTKEDLLESREFQRLFEAADHGVLAFGTDSMPLFTNVRMARILHCAPQDLLLHTADFLHAPTGLDRATLRRADGQPVAVRTGVVPMSTAGRDELGTLLLADDAEPPSSDFRLTRTRLHDPLTGLPNRAYLSHQLASAPPGQGAAIVLCNLRGFAMFTKQYGCARSEQLLGAVADRLQRQVAPPQFLARLDRDEFIVALPGTDSALVMREIADRLRGAFATLVRFDHTDYQARLSCGTAFRPAGAAVDLDELVAEAARSAH